VSMALTDVEQWSGKDRGDENFPVGAIVAPRLRPHVRAFYSFARNADDISDSPLLAAEDKIARLDVMEAVLIGRSDVGSPSALALRGSLAATGVTSAHASELLVAFRRDATKLRTESWADLYDYCRYSAMPVGRYMLDLHGESRDTWKASDALCTSLQVLNHLQDCQKDLKALDRCYLPLDLLAANGVAVADVLASAETPGLRHVFTALLDQCTPLNNQGAELPPQVRDRRLRIETAIIVGLARRLTERLRNGDPLAARVKLTKADAISAIVAALRFAP
jgi:squalene synthase HpnC